MDFQDYVKINLVFLNRNLNFLYKSISRNIRRKKL